MRRSLRTRLVLGATLGTAGVFLAAGVLLYALVRDGLVAQFDRALLDKARLLASATEWEDEELDLNFDEFDMHEFDRADRPAYLQVWLTDGAVAFRSPSLAGADLERLAGSLDAPLCRRVILPDGRPGRATGFTMTPKTEGSSPPSDAAAVTVVLARGTAPVDAVLAQLAMLLVLVGLVAVGLSAGVLWLTVRRGLRPVDGLANQIAGLGEADLAARLEAPDAPRELVPVVDRLNDLLGRLEAAFQRERGFSADVAHELRTPLAGIRSTLDVALTRPRGAPEYEEVLRGCLRIAVQLQRMVEHLLTLARLDAGQVEIRPEAVCVNTLARDAWEPLTESAEARRLQVRWALGDDVRVTTDRSLLDLVVRNVLENAVVHADEGGSVVVETAAKGHGADVRVTNSGSRLSGQQADHVFERFWRGDAARTEAGVHCGLGLPLVKEIVAALGGSVAVQSTEGGEFEITISIPTARPHFGP